jgi:hypothetical protein
MGWGARRLFIAVLVATTVVASTIAIGPVSTGRSSATKRQESRTQPRRVPKAGSVTAVATADGLTVSDVRAEADWILSAQLPDGAIAHYPDKVRILPYLSSFAAVGLSRATAVTGDRRYVQAAWRWLRWYQEHQNADGFVTDYENVDGVLRSTGDMDSTDAYAGMFLLAAWTVWEQTHDVKALRGLRPGITGAVRAMERTLDTDGLTWAKPSWLVKYLMDQAEVHAGFRAASRLFAALGDRSSARSMASRASDLRAAIDSMWQSSLGSYDWAKHEDGARAQTDWSRLYPDALQQMWAVAFGVASPAAGEEIVGRFRTAHPYWASPEQVDALTTDVEPYWPVAGWALPQSERPAAGRSILEAARRAGRAWPYNPAIAGQLIVLMSGGPALP